MLFVVRLSSNPLRCSSDSSPPIPLCVHAPPALCLLFSAVFTHACEVAIAEPKKPKTRPSTDGALGGDEDHQQQQQEGRAGAPPPVVAVKIKAKRKKCVWRLEHGVELAVAYGRDVGAPMQRVGPTVGESESPNGAVVV